MFANSNNVDASHGVWNDVGGNLNAIYVNYVNTSAPEILKRERRTIAEWLSPLNFKVSQNETFQKREDGTGQWLLDSQEFKDWRDAPSETLWCPGIPGAGKTMLSSIVINHLQQVFKNDNVAILFIYCNYKEQTEQTVANLIASLLKQLVQDCTVISDVIKSLYERHIDQNTRPTITEYTKALQYIIGTYSKVFVVVDALDECSQDNGTRADLLIALRSFTGGVNLMVTSRELLSIAQYFQGMKRLDIRASNQDVRKYIEGRIARTPRRHLKTMQESIVNKIIDNAEGMFLLARLHMDSLMGKHSPAAVRRALENLPKEVDDTYNEAMERIRRQNEDDKELAEQVLSWIAYARRPLFVRELQHALAVMPDTTHMDPDAIIDEEILTSVCAGLVIIEERSIIGLVHYTAHQYFERMRDSQLPNAQASITATCLTYLSFDVFGRGFCHTDQDLESILEENLLLDYAARHWGHHARGRVEESCKDMALRFLQDKFKIACTSQVLLMHSNYRHPGYSQHLPRYISGMHISSFFGLALTTRYQLENGAKADLRDSVGRVPLSYAAENGYDSVVKLLLGRDDVDVNSKDTRARTPLSLAAENGHEAVVKVLLARDDVNVNSKDEWPGRTPLSFAAENGHEAVVKLLLARDDIHVDSKDEWPGRTPLLFAAERGQKGVVKLLLARDDVDVNSKDITSRTPLSYAAENGHDATVTLLMTRNNIDVNSKDTKSSKTPLSFAAENGHNAVVELLLTRDDVDVNSVDTKGRTALLTAVWYGHEAVVKLLLDRDDIAVNLKDHWGRTPLSYEAENGHEMTVNLLLRHNIDVNSKEKSFSRTPLSLAVKNGHDAVVNLLLARDDVNVNSVDTEGWTALLTAVRYGREAVVKLLLDRDDIAVNLKDHRGRTPLSCAAENGHEMMVNLLLRHNIDVNSKETNFSQTPLSLAAENGHDAVVNLLLARDDVNVNSVDTKGRTALLTAVWYGHEAVVKLLLDRDDSAVNLKDQRGRTPLSYAAENGHEMTVNLLLRHNIDVNSKDTDFSQTPLSLAIENGHDAVVKLLLARDDVDVNLVDTKGRTALSTAVLYGNEVVVNLLLARGDVGMDSKDTTPLCLQSKRDEAVVKLLLSSNDVDVNSKDQTGRTQLWYGSEFWHELDIP